MLASDRITTQWRETELTHGADRRDFDEAGAAGFVEDSAGLDATRVRTGVGVGSTDAIVRVTEGGMVGLGADVIAGFPVVSDDATLRGVAAGEMAGAVGGAIAGTVVSGATWLVGSVRATLSRPMLSALASVVAGVLAGGVVVAVVLARAVSAGSGSECDFVAVFVFLRGVSGAPVSRRNNAVPTIITNAAAPTPLQTLAAIGARSGLVPHHRHSPRFSR